MEYGKIIAVTGLPGLFELLSSKNDGAIVRSLEDQSTKFVSSRVHNFSHLESIEVFTVKDNVNLTEIFQAMEKDGTKAPDGKDGAALKKYFEKVFPDLDFERVYSSDLKKMVKWFDILKSNKIEIKLTEQLEEEVAEEPASVKASAGEAGPKEEKEAAPKKAVKAKAASPAETSTDAASPAVASAKAGEEKPKKAPAKKKAESAEAKEEKEAAPKKVAKKAAPKKK